MRRVAIILNRNAQGVNASRIARVRALAGDEHVFVTASADDARGAIATVVAFVESGRINEARLDESVDRIEALFATVE